MRRETEGELTAGAAGKFQSINGSGKTSCSLRPAPPPSLHVRPCQSLVRTGASGEHQSFATTTASAPHLRATTSERARRQGSRAHLPIPLQSRPPAARIPARAVWRGARRLGIAGRRGTPSENGSFLMWVAFTSMTTFFLALSGSASECLHQSKRRVEARIHDLLVFDCRQLTGNRDVAFGAASKHDAGKAKKRDGAVDGAGTIERETPSTQRGETSS